MILEGSKAVRASTATPVPDHFGGIVGASPPMQELYRLLQKVIASESTILVTGENGTGKELVAKAIHQGGPRASKPFVVQNCSAFNDNLLDSELFGHKRGAFTGAQSDKMGLFEAANHGTFFLDEIGDMSAALQVKVLRVLQEGTLTPVGGTEERRVDVRVVAATNRDLQAMVRDGTFREDLYYRVHVINIQVPPLRERAADIEALANHFLTKQRGAKPRPKSFSAACIQAMRDYAWPGNVRELENEVERSVVLSSGEDVVGVSMLSPRISGAKASTDTPPIAQTRLTIKSLPKAVEDLERRMIRDALVRHQWNKTHAAEELEISRRNLIRMVQRYELE